MLFGSTSVWQCPTETIALMSELTKKSSSIWAIILSKDSERFEKLVEYSSLGKFRFVSAEFGEVNDYLNAADFAVLIREENAVNFVASPVKFAEYSMTGLQVITTNAVEQVVNYGAFIGNIVLHNNEDVGLRLVDSLFVNEGMCREIVSREARIFYDRGNYVKKYLSLCENTQTSQRYSQQR
jgi:hypothetical protein